MRYYLVKTRLRDGTYRVNIVSAEGGASIHAPTGGFVKEAHCYDCACLICYFGLTDEGAFEFNHGNNPDTVFLRG